MPEQPGPGPRPWTLPGERLLAVALFAAGLLALVLAHAERPLLADTDLGVALFFLVFGLFTISIGYAHPVFGHVSFDRVAQVSSILVLGPADAALINGCASLLYPLHRIRKGVPLRTVLNASLTNAGLMTLMILAGGAVYVAAGGPVPLTELHAQSFVAVLLLLVVMQAINEAGMMVLFRIRSRRALDAFSAFDTTMELSAGVVAVLVAIVWTRMEPAVLWLLLAVLAAGMVALKRFAEMRLRLERLVEARTEALNEKTLQLERQATRDTLTGLFNRRYADEFLRRELSRAQRHGHGLVVAIADIDWFKRINDDHSHATGDHVLQRVSALLAEGVRATDLVARYGGEEFMFCFVETDGAEAARVCEKLRLAVETHDWAATSAELSVTLSFGLAIAREQDTVESLAAAADARLYEAKRRGRNRVVAGAALGSA